MGKDTWYRWEEIMEINYSGSYPKITIKDDTNIRFIKNIKHDTPIILTGFFIGVLMCIILNFCLSLE
jgi:hypothetical protein